MILLCREFWCLICKIEAHGELLKKKNELHYFASLKRNRNTLLRTKEILWFAVFIFPSLLSSFRLWRLAFLYISSGNRHNVVPLTSMFTYAVVVILSARWPKSSVHRVSLTSLRDGEIHICNKEKTTFYMSVTSGTNTLIIDLNLRKVDGLWIIVTNSGKQTLWVSGRLNRNLKSLKQRPQECAYYRSQNLRFLKFTTFHLLLSSV